MSTTKPWENAFILVKMDGGIRYKLPVERLLNSMADRWIEYEAMPREEALELAWLDLQQDAKSEDALEVNFTFDGVNEWSDWEAVAERLPSEPVDISDLWGDAKVELIQAT